MNNSKANKQTVEWPPLLNMSENRPWVDTSFRNVEQINAPYLNEMLQPVWIKNLEKEYVHDTSGNSYRIEDDGKLYKNNRALFPVDNCHFVRQDVTEDFIDVIAYDETDSSVVSVKWDDDGNRFEVTFNGNKVYSSRIYEEGSVVASRVRIINNKAVFVSYYDVADVGYVLILVIDENGVIESQIIKEAKWYRQTIRRSGTAQPTWGALTIKDADPIISIASVFEGTIGISLVSGRNRCLNTVRNGFITYLLNNGELKQVGVDITPTTTATSTTVDVTTTYSWAWNNSVSNNVVNQNAISSDNTTFYKYDSLGVKGEEITFPSGNIPSLTGQTVTIDGVSYNIYEYTAYKSTLTVQLAGGTGSDTSKVSWKGVVKLLNDSYVETAYNDTFEKKLTVSTSKPYSDDDIALSVMDIIKAIKITWTKDSHEYVEEVALTRDNYPFFIVYGEYTTQQTISVSWLTSPNVVLDNGRLYALWAINRTYGANWNNQTLTNGNAIQESGTISSLSWSNNQYTITPVEFISVTSNYNVARSNSFAVGQNFVTTTTKLNNASAIVPSSLAGGTKETATSIFLEYNNSNCSDVRYYPGTFNDATFNYYGDQTSSDPLSGAVEDQLIYTVSGYRTTVNNGNNNWNLLYYIDSSNTLSLQGISYAEGNSMGTLVTPWYSVDDTFYVVANSEHVIYKDNSGRYYKVSLEEGTSLFSLLDDRYIVVNTTSYWNCYDSVLDKKCHYATDFNNRVMFGQTPVPDANTLLHGAVASGPLTYNRVTGMGINPNYVIMPRLGITSPLFPTVNRTRVLVSAEEPYQSVVPESSDTQPISIFYGNLTDTNAKYQYDIYPYVQFDKKLNSKYIDSIYNFTEVYLSPNIFTSYVNGAGNNDIVVEGYNSGVLTYDNQQPFLLYKAASLNTSYGTSQVAFFVLQGQFYAVMNDKIYSVVYNNGIISAQDAIIDIRGLQFVGNNPEIAFFFSPSKRMFYSFTGDAILAAIYNASKLHSIDLDTKHWYDEMTQTIYVSFEEGLLVFGQKNTYLFENWKNVTNVQVSRDGVTHITSNGITWDMVYYEKEGYEVLPLKLETSFYGLGAGEYTAIDRWDIVLYNNNHKRETSWLKVKERSLTNITEESNEQTFTITPEMYDKWSYSYLKPYVPQLQKGVGLKLEIETPLTIVRVVPHIMDMETSMTNKRNTKDTQNTVFVGNGEM